MVKRSTSATNLIFAALADPTRRRMLEQLARENLCVTALAEPHAMSLPAISKHLRVLEEAGLVKRRREGRLHTLALQAKPLQQVQTWIESCRQFWDANLDRLDAHLKQEMKRHPQSLPPST